MTKALIQALKLALDNIQRYNAQIFQQKMMDSIRYHDEVIPTCRRVKIVQQRRRSRIIEPSKSTEATNTRCDTQMDPTNKDSSSGEPDYDEIFNAATDDSIQVYS